MKIKHRGGLGTATLLGKASFNAGVSPLLIVAPPTVGTVYFTPPVYFTAAAPAFL